MADDDAFLLAAAELLEQQHQQRNATQNAAHIPRQSQPLNVSSTKQLSPSVLKRIEANRAAALARLQKASAAALNSNIRTNPSIPPPACIFSFCFRSRKLEQPSQHHLLFQTRRIQFLLRTARG